MLMVITTQPVKMPLDISFITIAIGLTGRGWLFDSAFDFALVISKADLRLKANLLISNRFLGRI